MGDNIAKEYELLEKLDGSFTELYKNIKSTLKDYGISSSKSELIKLFGENKKITQVITKLASKNFEDSKEFREILFDALINIEKNDKLPNINLSSNVKDEKFEYFKKNYSNSKSLIVSIDNFFVEQEELSENSNIREIEENQWAIRVLEKFKNKIKCIVCDNDGINSEELLKNKELNKKNILNSLNDKTKEFVKNIIENINDTQDYFGIQDAMFSTIEERSIQKLIVLKNDIKHYKEIFLFKIINEIKSTFEKSQIPVDYANYKKIIKNQVEIKDDDIQYIKKIIENDMGKELDLKRKTEDNRIEIFLAGREFLGKERGELPLSAGEQNFLSLTFEFLKAKNSNKPIIVLDDPISSFDSIYKNKVSHAILKILKNKKIIILTHNVDLIRLLDTNWNNSFNLFLFNNNEKEENGFIKVNLKEVPMLIYVEKLVKTLQIKKNNDKFNIYQYIKNEKLFLISLIPFMRKFAEIILDDDSVDKLSKLMHSEYREKINILEIYKKLFKSEENISYSYSSLNVQDILDIDIENMQMIEIIDKKEFPLLNKTLIHTLTYLYLRLLVERKIVSQYLKDKTIIKNKKMTLGKLISECFHEKDSNSIKNFLFSKKTLLNEFNHFEGTLSIFQPAIDINDAFLEKEKESILNFVNNDQID